MKTERRTTKKHTVPHVCGHNQVHDLYGTDAERVANATWLEKNECLDCWKSRVRGEIK